MFDPKTEKLIRRTSMVGTCVAAYFILTADYGPQPNALTPIKRAIKSAESSAKDFIFGTSKETQNKENETPKA